MFGLVETSWMPVFLLLLCAFPCVHTCVHTCVHQRPLASVFVSTCFHQHFRSLSRWRKIALVIRLVGGDAPKLPSYANPVLLNRISIRKTYPQSSRPDGVVKVYRCHLDSGFGYGDCASGFGKPSFRLGT